MTTTKIYASLNDLTKQPCNAYHNLPKDQELDVIAEIIRVRGRLILDDLTWVIANCPKLQTTEILDTFIAQKPEAHEIRMLITVCAFAQSDKMLDAYLNTNPTKQEIRLLMVSCSFAQSEKMLAAFINAKATANEVPLTCYGVACLLGISPKTVQRHAKSGKLFAFKRGGVLNATWHIPIDDPKNEAYVKKHQHKKTINN